VRDAVTGQLLPDFRIMTGWPARDYSNVIVGLRWSGLDRFCLRFKDGIFRHVYEEPVVVGHPNPEFVFRFEADGYMPFTTRLVQAGEREVHFDVALRAAPSTTVTVLNPDGSAAVGADVALGSADCPVVLVPGGLARQDFEVGASLLSCDARGQFRMRTEDSILRVVAANSHGYSEATPAELASLPTLQLLPWSRLEGTLLSDGSPVPDAPLLFRPGSKEGNGVTSDFVTFRARTDAAGRFVFRQVPPRRARIVGLTPTASSNGIPTLTAAPVGTLDIRPGETARATFVVPAAGSEAAQP
jgi:hypothetical protein